jgi:signal transduction histidine kinase/streptogramin lyase
MKRALLCLLLCCSQAPFLRALDPLKALTRFSQTTWTQKEGLPQDAISAIVQTTDGYLWLGTEEGLARFDGYDFTIFNKDSGDLPSNTVTVLVAATDGSLWIGTANGLAHYHDKRFTIYTIANGLPDNSIANLYVDHTGTLWIVAGGAVSRVDGERIHLFAASEEIPFTVWTLCEDRHGTLWVAGFSGLARWDGSRFVSMVGAAELGGNLITTIVLDGSDNIWMAGTLGVVRRSNQGEIRKFDTRHGLPHVFVRALRFDRNGTLWAGTNSGLARLTNDRFTTLSGPEGRDRDLVRCLYEDREGNLWVGASNGLSRFRDDIFTAYGKSEGLPGDDPNTLYQDREGRVWVGFHNSGLLLFSPGGGKRFNTDNGLPSNEVFSIRQDHHGDILLNTRGGLVRMKGSQFKTYRPMDQLGRDMVFDSLEDSTGRLWLALPQGLAELKADGLRIVVPGGPLIESWVVSLMEANDGALWVGTYGRGLWRIGKNNNRQFTTDAGLSSNQIRSLYQDREGTIWIATFGGGLNELRDGVFSHFTVKDGLLSDNISKVMDDGEALWLATPRGICRISKQQLRAFSRHERRTLQPSNYGVEDGLRSAQCAPGYPVAGGGSRTADGRLWFPTSRGLAVIDPNAPQPPETAPIVHLVDVTVDSKAVELRQSPRLKPGSERIQIRYTAIHLSAPERVQYFHKLEGLDTEWTRAGRRREINYNSLAHGTYRFVVRAQLPGGPATEEAYSFEKLPKFHETISFRLLTAGLLIAGIWGVYQLRVRQLRYRFALVLQERARLAREIHDTLAQGFVGISSQLEAVATELPDDLSPARRYLDLARRMARHSITEARRSVIDLRAAALEGQNLAAALHSGAQIWTAGSGVEVEVDIAEAQQVLPEEFEQHLLRITQEAVTNVVKHAGATRISVKMQLEGGKIRLCISDNGRGFDQQKAFSQLGGHFGLIGMRERAERLGGELKLASEPGQGTQILVTVPLR